MCVSYLDEVWYQHEKEVGDDGVGAADAAIHGAEHVPELLLDVP